MDKNRWATQEFKALGSHNINVATEFLSADYKEPEFEPIATVGDTGLLRLMRIEPRTPGLPAFSVRWDQKEDSINVDLVGESEDALYFSKGRAGYCGHKTNRISENPRTQEIDIDTPITGPVFKGAMALNIQFGLSLAGSLSMKAEFEAHAEVIREGRIRRLVAKLKAFVKSCF